MDNCVSHFLITHVSFAKMIHAFSLFSKKKDAGSNPDWDFMERYIKSLPYSACLQG